MPRVTLILSEQPPGAFQETAKLLPGRSDSHLSGTLIAAAQRDVNYDPVCLYCEMPPSAPENRATFERQEGGEGACGTSHIPPLLLHQELLHNPGSSGKHRKVLNLGFGRRAKALAGEFLMHYWWMMKINLLLVRFRKFALAQIQTSPNSPFCTLRMPRLDLTLSEVSKSGLVPPDEMLFTLPISSGAPENSARGLTKAVQLLNAGED